MHDPLEIPTEYNSALEEVLGLSLTREAGSREYTQTIRRIAAQVEAISKGLTTEREEFVASKYLKDAAQQEAYRVYYMTTNLLKLWPPLNELAQRGFFELSRPINHLDLGAGTGTASASLALYLAQHYSSSTLRSLATDSLTANLASTRQFAEVLGRHLDLDLDVRTELWDLSKPDRVPPLVGKEASYDLITIMNVLNELPESDDDALIASLSELVGEEGAIVMIEPSTRELSRRALRFRDRMVAHNYFVYAPCTRAGKCPALLIEDDWCHTEIPWKRPKFIREIDDIAGTLRLSLKATYGVFLRKDSNLTDFALGQRDFHVAGRVVSEGFHEKGRSRCIICNEEGRREYVVNKRDLTRTNREAREVARYDLVEVRGAEGRAHDVKVRQESTFNILSDASGAPNVDKWGASEDHPEKNQKF